MKLPTRRTVQHLRDVVRVLVARDQKSRYSNTLMGVLWAVASPVLFLLTFYLLFRVILPLNIPNYASHVFVGLVVWSWFQNTVSDSVGCIVGNPGAVNQPRFPVVALPVAVATSHFVTILLTLPLLVVILWFEGATPGVSLLSLPLLIGCQYLFVLAVGFLVAGLNVRFRDLAYIVPILLQLGYFATPIFYDVSSVPPEVMQYVGLNPMLVLIEAYRAVLIRGEWPDANLILLVLAGSCLLLLITMRYFLRARDGFLEEI